MNPDDRFLTSRYNVLRGYGRANWALRRVNLGMAVASLLFVGISAACTQGANSDEPIYTPRVEEPRTTTTTTAAGFTAEDVVDAMGADQVAAYCDLVDAYEEIGWTDSEMFTAFAEGFGEPVGGVTARAVWVEFLSRCR